jgi:hypothetical protein
VIDIVWEACPTVKLQLALPELPVVLFFPSSVAVRVPLKEPTWTIVPLNPDPFQLNPFGKVPDSPVNGVELHPPHEAVEETLTLWPYVYELPRPVETDTPLPAIFNTTVPEEFQLEPLLLPAAMWKPSVPKSYHGNAGEAGV